MSSFESKMDSTLRMAGTTTLVISAAVSAQARASWRNSKNFLSIILPPSWEESSLNELAVYMALRQFHRSNNGIFVQLKNAKKITVALNS